MHIYDKCLNLFLAGAQSKATLDESIKSLGIPDLYVYDQRYTILWLLTEMACRKNGFFISRDLKDETNLSDKSVERFINFLVKKGFYTVKQGRDKRVKLYFPTPDLHTHIMKTWSMRTAQWKALSEFGVENLKEGSEYFKGLKKYPFPEGKESF